MDAEIWFNNEGKALKVTVFDAEGTQVNITELSDIKCRIYHLTEREVILKYGLTLDEDGEKIISVSEDETYGNLIIEPDDLALLPLGIIIIQFTYYFPDDKFSSGNRSVTKKGILCDLKDVVT